jgi:hypothetical protein
MKCPTGHTFDVFGHMADPPHSASCDLCHKPASRDYAEEFKTKQVGFIDGVEFAHLPRESGAPLAGDERHPTRRVIKNKRDWTEMCKRNNWTDYSNSSGPPE